MYTLKNVLYLISQKITNNATQLQYEKWLEIAKSNIQYQPILLLKTQYGADIYSASP